MGKSISEKFEDFIFDIIALIILGLIIWFPCKLYFSNQYSFIVSMKSIFDSESFHKMNKEMYTLYSEQELFLQTLPIRKDDKLKGSSMCLVSNILQIDKENKLIVVASNWFTEIRCILSGLKSESLIEELSEGDKIVVCGKLGDRKEMEIEVMVENIAICNEDNPDQYDFADGSGELHYYNTWIEKKLGDVTFKIPGWKQSKLGLKNDGLTYNFQNGGKLTIQYYDYDMLKKESEEYDGSPLEFSDNTVFNLYLLEITNGSGLKYSLARNENVNGIDFTYYRGEPSFFGDKRVETYFIVVNKGVVVFSVEYYKELPQEIYYTAIILGTAIILEE